MLKEMAEEHAAAQAACEEAGAEEGPRPETGVDKGGAVEDEAAARAAQPATGWSGPPRVVAAAQDGPSAKLVVEGGAVPGYVLDRAQSLTTEELRDGLDVLLSRVRATDITIKQSRHSLARHFGLPDKALDARKGELRDLAKVCIQEGCNRELPLQEEEEEDLGEEFGMRAVGRCTW